MNCTAIAWADTYSFPCAAVALADRARSLQAEVQEWLKRNKNKKAEQKDLLMHVCVALNNLSAQYFGYAPQLIIDLEIAKVMSREIDGMHTKQMREEAMQLWWSQRGQHLQEE